MYHRVALVIALTLSLAPSFLTAQERSLPPAVGSISLVTSDATPVVRQLDVGVAIFDPGIPEDKSSHSKLGVFPEIRKSEAQFMAVILRQVLVDSNAWGVVRVLPEPVDSTELLITGAVIHSDGEELVLQVEARDATGRVWLSRLYRDMAGEQDYPVAPGTDPFIDLYHAIANDLLAVKAPMKDRELGEVRQVAMLRYAASLSPEAFAGYLGRDAEGHYQLSRLPAQGDPMMSRVERIRNQEFLFIDTVDENYADLYLQMAPTYHLWRQYGREQAIYREEYRDRVANRESRGRQGSFAALQQTYDAYKWSKIHEQDLDEMALGFNNEVTPTVLEVSGKLFRLNGTLETQYNDWREILRQIFALETGLPPAVEGG